MRKFSKPITQRKFVWVTPGSLINANLSINGVSFIIDVIGKFTQLQDF